MNEKDTYKSPETVNPQRASSYKENPSYSNTSDLSSLRNETINTVPVSTSTAENYKRQELISILLVAILLLFCTIYIAGKINLKKRS